MTAKKRKKNVRLRGKTTHGWGSMKKHRGAGHRGGRGNAGSGKRADQKRPSYWKDGKSADKIGFTSWRRISHVTINVGHLDSIADTLVREGKAMMAQDAYVINLRELGFTKLLAAGTVTKKLRIGVSLTTPTAKAKVEKAGGVVDSDAVADREGVIATRDENARVMREKRAPKKSAAATPKAEAKAEE